MGVLDGKVAIVTGAGTGLGRGIAQELADAGASIAVAMPHLDRVLDPSSYLGESDEIVAVALAAWERVRRAVGAERSRL